MHGGGHWLAATKCSLTHGQHSQRSRRHQTPERYGQNSGKSSITKAISVTLRTQPYLSVRIEASRPAPDWNTYVLVSTIELARDERPNPPVPDWLQPQYADSLHTLAEIASARFSSAKDTMTARGMLAILAISKQARTYARLLVSCAEDEVLELIESGA